MKANFFFSAILMTLCCGGVDAANLLTNPHFDFRTSAWSNAGLPGLSIEWSSSDAMDSPTSGSMALINTQGEPGNGHGPFMMQCVAVTGGLSYDVGARVAVPPFQSNTGYGTIALYFYREPGCDWTKPGNTMGGPFVQGTDRQLPGQKFVPFALRGVVAPAGARSVHVFLGNSKIEGGGSFTVLFDDVVVAPSGGCVPDASTLCLNDRFSVTASYATSSSTGNARVEQLTSDSGYLWFFSATNVETIVKVLNGCAVNGHYWVFAGGLTNVDVKLDVTDTATHVKKTYANPQGSPFQPIQDTEAFATCP